MPTVEGPFLYVAGDKLSKYAVGSSRPLRSHTTEYVEQATVALDRHGHLCEANGDISFEQLFEFDARTLRALQVVNGTGAFNALVADSKGYTYAATQGPGIYVYAPGCTKRVNNIRRGLLGASGVESLVFDRSGNLYAGNFYQVSVYTPTGKPGHMKFVRHIKDGIYYPIALAIGPSGDLFVANGGDKRGYITVYEAGASKPMLTITDGIKDPSALVLDSQSRLFVANAPERPPTTHGWVSVYAPGGTQPIEKITTGIHRPTALALDPADNLYVVNYYVGTVTVYSAEHWKLLHTIKRGVNFPQALLIGAP